MTEQLPAGSRMLVRGSCFLSGAAARDAAAVRRRLAQPTAAVWERAGGSGFPGQPNLFRGAPRKRLRPLASPPRPRVTGGRAAGRNRAGFFKTPRAHRKGSTAAQAQAHVFGCVRVVLSRFLLDGVQVHLPRRALT